MKSSTIRRSNLSRESMEVIENLAKNQGEQDLLSEYVRNDSSEPENNTNKSQEIDLLWQNFKTTQFNTNSPTAYILLGVLIGIILTTLTIGILGYSTLKAHNGTITINKFVSDSSASELTYEQETDEIVSEEQKVNIPTDETSQDTNSETAENEVQAPSFDTSKMQKYIVKSGDTGESIIKRFYGSYTPERAEIIIKVNKLDNLDRLSIDQELLIPAEQ